MSKILLNSVIKKQLFGALRSNKYILTLTFDKGVDILADHTNSEQNGFLYLHNPPRIIEQRKYVYSSLKEACVARDRMKAELERDRAKIKYTL